MDVQPEDGEITMMFTDIVASSLIKRLLGTSERDQDRVWVDRFQRQHHEMIRQCYARFDGVEVKTIGDAFFVTFTDAANAVRCAVEIQQQLAAAHIVTPAPHVPRLSVRIGLHTSKPVRQGSDYVGTSVDLAARIESAAVGDQILISQRTRDLIAANGADISLYEQGEFPLKGMGVHFLYEVLWGGQVPQRTGQRELLRYCEEEKNRILDERAPGFRNLRVRDAITGALFTSPPWKDIDGTERTDDVCEHIVSNLLQDRSTNVIVLGQPGQGKTTILKRVFLLLCDQVLSRQGQRIPVYLPLRDCCHAPVETGGTREWLWNYLSNEAGTRLPLDFEQFQSFLDADRFVFLFDGFDELELSTQSAVNRVVKWPIFSLPAVMTCRRNYYDLYLRASAIEMRYNDECELTSWDVESEGRRYIQAFEDFRQIGSNSSLQMIVASESMRELAGRPLLLTMMLDVLATPDDDRDDVATSISGLYEEYIDKLLAYEAGKPGSVLAGEEKSAILQSLAWSLFVSRRSDAEAYGDCCSGTVCTRQELQDIIERNFLNSMDCPVGDAIQDLRLRSILAENRRNRISFLHMSFMEFYVAKYIVERISRDVAGVADVLGESIPLEVGVFLRDMLSPSRMSLSARERISDHLIESAENFQATTGRGFHVREHAVFYLSTLRTERGRRYLEERYRDETNKIIQRSMLVGLAYSWNRHEFIDEYVRWLRQDDEAAEVNIGYHLIYFGDQPSNDDYHDLGRRCSRTVNALMRHLRDTAFRSISALDLLTLRMLMERRGSAIVSAEDASYLLDSSEDDQFTGESIHELAQVRRMLNGARQ